MKPYDYKIGSVTDTDVLKRLYEECVGISEEAQEELASIIDGFQVLRNRVRRLQSEKKKASSKAIILKRKLDSIEAAKRIEFRKWYVFEEGYFYPCYLHRTSGRMIGDKITKDRLSPGYYKSKRDVYEHYRRCPLSGDSVNGSCRLISILQEGTDITGRLESMRKHRWHSYDSIHRGFIVRSKSIICNECGGVICHI